MSFQTHPSESREAATSVNSIPATRTLQDQTSLQTASQTPILTLINTPTISITTMLTMESAVKETSTLTPTITDTELRQLALDLFESNNGCQLPCWWGITPGQTEWETAYELIKFFDRVPHRVSDSESVFYEPRIPLPAEVFGDSGMGQFYTVQNDIVVRIDTPVAIGDIPEGYLAQYDLPAFLTTFGLPTEIWISTYRAAFEEGDLPFFTVLFYSEQGIVASYKDNGVRQGDIVQGCPQENPVSHLVLMPPNLRTYPKNK